MTPEWVDRRRVLDVSSRGIASYVAELIRHGELDTGEALPPVRTLAEAFRVSPATVSAAWGVLKKRGLIAGTGKSGIRVASPAGITTRQEFYSTVPGHHDLRLLYPDVDLLPPLDDALISAAHLPNLNEYYDSAILPTLREVVEPEWPYPSEAFVVANGGADALWSVLHSNSVPGDRIVVEAPTQPQLLALMQDLGLTIMPVPYLADGLSIEHLAAAMKSRPVAVFWQPRAQVPTGRATSEQTVAELVRVLGASHRPMLIEYDDLATLAHKPLISVGRHLPEQTVVIRSYEKSYGPDLRLAVLGATTSTVRAIHAQIRMRRQWTSRILQSTLAWLLRDDGIRLHIEHARAQYADRLVATNAALLERGVASESEDGFCVWVRVQDEPAAVSWLADRGVLVLGGASSYPRDPVPHVRVAVSRLPLDVMPQLCDLIADAKRVYA